MDNWTNTNFESSSSLTPQFAAFARDYKKHLKAILSGVGLELISFNRGHFYLSGFIHNPLTDKYAYFSISDVRGGHDEWLTQVLVRSAKHDKDYTGGANGFVGLPMVGTEALSLTQGA